MTDGQVNLAFGGALVFLAGVAMWCAARTKRWQVKR